MHGIIDVLTDIELTSAPDANPLGKTLLRLAAEADAVVEDLPPGRRAPSGLGYEQLEQARAGIILTSIPLGAERLGCSSSGASGNRMR